MELDPRFVELALLFERRQVEDATAFAVVELDNDGVPFRVVCPFEQAEQALIAGEREVARWNDERSCEEDGDISYVVVPMWGPDA